LIIALLILPLSYYIKAQDPSSKLNSIAMADDGPMSVDSETGMKPPMETPHPTISGHHLPKNDPENPMSWPMPRRIFASLVAWLFTAAV
jgi:hypothetical protein